MQIENNIIVTSLEELKDIVRHCSLDNMEGQINLTIKGNDIEVWQPSKEAVNDGVIPAPRYVSMTFINEIGVIDDEQPTDNCTH